MKKIITILAFAITLTTTNVMAKGKPTADKSVVVLLANENVFQFKVKSEIIGGVVEVYDATEKLLAMEELTEREMRIDFIDLPAGKYTIKVKKLNQVTSFSYNKSDVAAE